MGKVSSDYGNTIISRRSFVELGVGALIVLPTASDALLALGSDRGEDAVEPAKGER